MNAVETLENEVTFFIKTQISDFEKVGVTIQGTFLDKPTVSTLHDLYLQLKYLVKLGGQPYIKYTNDMEKLEHVHQVSEVFMKLFVRPIDHIKGDLRFTWGEYSESLTATEFMHIIMAQIGTFHEYHFYLLKNNRLLNLVEISKLLGVPEETYKHIDKAESIFFVYNELARAASEHYGVMCNPLISQRQYEVRCAVMHMDYKFEKEAGGFAIIRSNGGRITSAELLQNTIDTFTKLNCLSLICNHFAKKLLPLDPNT